MRINVLLVMDNAASRLDHTQRLAQDQLCIARASPQDSERTVNP